MRKTDILVNVNHYESPHDAVAHVQNLGGGIVFFPKGTYNLSKGLLITQDNVRLVGESRGTTLHAVVKKGDEDSYPDTLIHFAANHGGVEDITLRVHDPTDEKKGDGETICRPRSVTGIKFAPVPTDLATLARLAPVPVAPPVSVATRNPANLAAELVTCPDTVLKNLPELAPVLTGLKHPSELGDKLASSYAALEGGFCKLKTVLDRLYDQQTSLDPNEADQLVCELPKPKDPANLRAKLESFLSAQFHYNRISNVYITGCSIGIDLQCGPRVRGPINPATGENSVIACDCSYNVFDTVYITYTDCGIRFQGSLSLEIPKECPKKRRGNPTTRNQFYSVTIQGVVNTGIQINAGSTNTFYGCSFEGINRKIESQKSNGQPTENHINVEPTAIMINNGWRGEVWDENTRKGELGSNECNIFFGAMFEDNCVDVNNGNPCTEFYGSNIGSLCGVKPLFVLGGHITTGKPPIFNGKEIVKENPAL